MTASEKTVSLVLGSGGARGLAHIGVIQYLLEHDYTIRYVAGSSIGALVGGIHAAGKLEAYTDWVCSLELSDVVRLMDLSLGRESLFKGERIISVLRDLIGEHEIQDLPIRYTAVATDLSDADGGREIWINKGPLFDAIRASIAIPSIFSPVSWNSRLLVDGSVTNPVPMGPTLNDHTDLTIAVNLNGKHEIIEPPSKQTPKSRDGIVAKFRRERVASFVDRSWPVLGRGASTTVPAMPDLIFRSMETMQQTITEFKFAANPPDVVVSIPRNLCGFFEFYRARELIEFGYQRAKSTLSQIG